MFFDDFEYWVSVILFAMIVGIVVSV